MSNVEYLVYITATGQITAVGVTDSANVSAQAGTGETATTYSGASALTPGAYYWNGSAAVAMAANPAAGTVQANTYTYNYSTHLWVANSDQLAQYQKAWIAQLQSRANHAIESGYIILNCSATTGSQTNELVYYNACAVPTDTQTYNTLNALVNRINITGTGSYLGTIYQNVYGTVYSSTTNMPTDGSLTTGSANTLNGTLCPTGATLTYSSKTFPAWGVWGIDADASVINTANISGSISPRFTLVSNSGSWGGSGYISLADGSYSTSSGTNKSQNQDIIQVHNIWRQIHIYRTAVDAQLNSLVGQIQAAGTIAAVQAIVWTNPTYPASTPF